MYFSKVNNITELCYTHANELCTIFTGWIFTSRHDDEYMKEIMYLILLYIYHILLWHQMASVLLSYFFMWFNFRCLILPHILIWTCWKKFTFLIYVATYMYIVPTNINRRKFPDLWYSIILKRQTKLVCQRKNGEGVPSADAMMAKTKNSNSIHRDWSHLHTSTCYIHAM